MPEATHDQIIQRVAAVEGKVADMQASSAVLDERTKNIAEDVTRVREHFESQFGTAVKDITLTREQLIQHRAEFQGLQTGIQQSQAKLSKNLGIGFSLLGLVIAGVGLVVSW